MWECFTRSNLMSNISVPLPGVQDLCLSILFSGHHISRIRYLHTSSIKADVSENDSIFAKKIRNELESYFNRSDSQFSVLCDLSAGTEFQQKVWQSLLDIPMGETQTYGFLAKKINTSARAVGNACRHNLFPVIIPCHRVVSATGIGGYAGDTQLNQQGQINYMQIKQWLLSHEKCSVTGK